MSKQNSLDLQNSFEFGIIKSTYFQLVYGKWAKYFNTKFSYLYLIFFLAIYIFKYFSIFNGYFDKLINDYTDIFTNNLVTFQTILTSIGMILLAINIYLLSYKYYSVKKVIPDSVKILEEKDQISPRLLDYKLIFSNGLKYNRLAFLITSVLCSISVFIKVHPSIEVIKYFGVYIGVIPSNYKLEYSLVIQRLFSQMSHELFLVFLYFIEFELILLSPIVLPFLNSRFKHITFAFVAITLINWILNIYVISFKDKVEKVDILFYSAQSIYIILWIVALCYNYNLQKQLNNRVQNNINNCKPETKVIDVQT